MQKLKHKHCCTMQFFDNGVTCETTLTWFWTTSNILQSLPFSEGAVTAEGTKHWNHNVLLHNDKSCYCQINRNWLHKFPQLVNKFYNVTLWPVWELSDNTSQMQAMVKQRTVQHKRCDKTVHFRTTTLYELPCGMCNNGNTEDRHTKYMGP